jgi:Na+-transporting methylmalonyl-CoA/oxaloacetate decarboxylase gamma subunit
MISNFGMTLYETTNLKLFICYKQSLEYKKYKDNIGFLFVACGFLFIFISFLIFIITGGVKSILKKLFKNQAAAPPKKKNKAKRAKKNSAPKKISIGIDENKKNDTNEEKYKTILSEKDKTILLGKDKTMLLDKDKTIFSDKDKTIILEKEEKSTDYDFDNAIFEISEKQDKRNCCKFFILHFLASIGIIKIFCFREKYELFFVCLALYITSLMFDFFMNAVLFSDDVISQKYNNQGEISPVTTYTLSIV